MRFQPGTMEEMNTKEKREFAAGATPQDAVKEDRSPEHLPIREVAR